MHTRAHTYTIHTPTRGVWELRAHEVDLWPGNCQDHGNRNKSEHILDDDYCHECELGDTSVLPSASHHKKVNRFMITCVVSYFAPRPITANVQTHAHVCARVVLGLGPKMLYLNLNIEFSGQTQKPQQPRHARVSERLWA